MCQDANQSAIAGNGEAHPTGLMNWRLKHSSMARGRHIPVDTVTSQGCATQSGLSKEDQLGSMEKSVRLNLKLDDVRSVTFVCSIRWRTWFNASRTMETSCLRWSRTQEIQSLEMKWSKWMQKEHLWIRSNLFILNSSGMMYCVHFNNVSSTSNTCSSLSTSTVAPYRHKCRTFDLVYITQPQCGASFEIHHDLQASVQKASDLSITTSCTLRVNDDIFCVHDGAWRDCGLGLSQRLQMDEDIRPQNVPTSHQVSSSSGSCGSDLAACLKEKVCSISRDPKKSDVCS